MVIKEVMPEFIPGAKNKKESAEGGLLSCQKIEFRVIDRKNRERLQSN